MIDPKQRIPDIAAMRLALEGAFETTAPPSSVAASPLQVWQRPISLAAAALLVIAAAIIGTWVLRPLPPPGQGSQLWVRRWAELTATPIRGTEGAETFALSPDEREVAFAAFPGPLRVVPLGGGQSTPWVTALDSYRTGLPMGLCISRGTPNSTLHGFPRWEEVLRQSKS